MPESLGEVFQKAREARGLTLDDAASKTRILPFYLKAVEENNYARLPDEVFAKGFVRSYARILGLDEIAVIKKFDESGGQFYAKRAERETLKLRLQEEERRKRINRNIVIGLVGVVLVVLLVLIGQEREDPVPILGREAPTARSQPSAPPAPAPQRTVPAPTREPQRVSPSMPAPLPAVSVPDRTVTAPAEVERNFSAALPLEGVVPDPKKLTLDIEARERTWVLVQADRAPAQDVLLNPGDRVRWKAQDRFTLTLGNAGGVRIYLNGTPQGPYGASGQVVRNLEFAR
jgi:cytoskeletal protein RodZ